MSDAPGEIDGQEQADLEIPADDTGEPPPDGDVQNDVEFDFPETCTSSIQCSDGNPCNGEETCTDDGTCIPGAAPAEGSACVTPEVESGVCIGGVCIPASCGNGIVEEMEECDDGRNGVQDDGCRDDCTTSCHASSECGDGNACTIDVCRTEGEGRLCAALPVDGLCNDGDPCTADDRCSDGACAGTEAGAELCDDGNDCTDDTCHPVSGCSSVPNANPCDTGSACFSGGVCSGGICLGTAPSGSCPCPLLSDCVGYDDLDLCNAALVCNASHNCVHDPATAVVCDSRFDTRCRKNTCDPFSGACAMTPVPDGRRCNDGNACTSDDRCLSGTCSGTDISDWCADYNDCTLESCDPGSGCAYVLSSLPCDDVDPCTALDHCQDTGECAGTPYTCDESDCVTSSTCDGSGGCDRTYAALGAECEDGASCSSENMCDGAGSCIGTLEDSLCGTGEVCRPLCFAAASGCGTPPQFLHMSCTDPVDLNLGSDGTCTINLNSVGGQAPCIHCEAKQGWTEIEFSDFGDREGSCSLDGWALIPGLTCGTDYNGSCDLTGAAGNCCAVFGTICNELNGRLVLQTDKAMNCGGGREEWRLWKAIDTTGLTDLTMCIDIGKSGAITNKEFLLIKIADGGNSVNLVCLDGTHVKNDITKNSDDTLFTMCYDLPGWAGDNDGLVVTVIANSNANGNILYVDDISIAGSSLGCAPNDVDLFRDSFSGCPDPINDGWNGWRVTGSPACPASIGCSDGAEADAAAWTIEHDVDSSTADGNIQLCFDLVDNHAGAGDSVLVEFSTDRGSRWQTAWNQVGDLGNDDSCYSVCRSLSRIDRSAARNPDLRIRFTLSSASGRIAVGNVAVTGTAYCPAGGSILLGPVTETSIEGRYEIGARDLGGVQNAAVVFCSWDEPADPVWGISQILYKQ